MTSTTTLRMASSSLLGLTVLLLLTDLALAHYTNEWAVQIAGGDQVADEVARQLNCRNDAKIFDDTYLFSHNHVSRRSAEPHAVAHGSFQEHPEVAWAEQQRVLSRKKRQMWRLPAQAEQEPQATFEDRMHFNDQRWAQMWYLNRGSRLDMNVQEAWAEGATGKGISITILDDGIERSHPDLVANYDPMASFDVNENDNDPTPRYDLVDSNRHGTRCAGEVAAAANNSECAVGIAYEAGIGGVRMLDGDVTDAVEARSLGLNNQHIHIYSASWGPDDDGKTVDGPGRLASRAFLQGISEGRGGRGSIFVWASGNGGRDHDNCNCDGYTNSIWTLSVSSATENGLIPWYSEACSSTLATTYSSGSSGERKVVTTDLHHTCTSSHTGTSASAPLAAGIIALTLQVNPELTWRDVQHLTVRCAHVANLKATDWAVNGLGRNFSHSFGYGIMDASCMVRTARQWKVVPEQKKCSRSADRIDLIVNGRTISRTSIEVKDCEEVNFLEHVQAHVTLSATKRGDVLMFLISPSGTRSNLIAKRPRDYSRAGFNDWPFLTVHMWEESPIGTWILEVQNEGRSVVQLKEWSLAFLGTKEPPQPQQTAQYLPQPASLPPPSVPAAESYVPTEAPPAPAEESVPASTGPVLPGVGRPLEDFLASPAPPQLPFESVPQTPQPSSSLALENCEEQLNSDWCSKCKPGFSQHVGRCVSACPAEGFFLGQSNHVDACLQCYYSCRTCSGPNDYECQSCYGDADLESESPTHRYCHNKSLIARVFSSSRWYYVLSLGFLLNFVIVVILIVYILRWRRRSREQAPILPRKITTATRKLSVAVASRKMSLVGVVGGGGSRYSPVKGDSSTAVASAAKLSSELTMPFRDYASSSEEEELYRKPYTDALPT